MVSSLSHASNIPQTEQQFYINALNWNLHNRHDWKTAGTDSSKELVKYMRYNMIHDIVDHLKEMKVSTTRHRGM